MKQKMVTTSITITPELLKEANQYLDNTSEAARQGIQTAIEKAKGIYEQQERIRKLRERRVFGRNLEKSLTELKREVEDENIEVKNLKEDELIVELVNYHSNELDMPERVLWHFLRKILTGEFNLKDFGEMTYNQMLELNEKLEG